MARDALSKQFAENAENNVWAKGAIAFLEGVSE